MRHVFLMPSMQYMTLIITKYQVSTTNHLTKHATFQPTNVGSIASLQKKGDIKEKNAFLFFFSDYYLISLTLHHMGVSINGGTPIWLVSNGKPY